MENSVSNNDGRIEVADLLKTLYIKGLNRAVDQLDLDSKVERFRSGAIDLAGLVEEIFAADAFTLRLPTLARERGLQQEGWTKRRGAESVDRPTDATARSSPGVSVARLDEVIRSLYATLLGRLPDDAGVQVVAQELASGTANMADVVGGILASEEFQEGLPSLMRRYGASDAGLLTSYKGVVNSLYHVLLDREPDEEGLASKLGGLRDGTFRLDDIIGELVGSKEFYDKLPAVLRRYSDDGLRPLIGAPAVINAIYVALLDREPDATGLEAKLSGLSQGVLSLTDVVGELLGSEEFYDKLPDVLKRFAVGEERYITYYGAVVRALYTALLDREPDEDGFASKIARLGRGELILEDVVREIVGSDEFFLQLPTLLNRNRADATRFVTDVSHLVVALYSVLLDREPEPVGLQSKIDRLAADALSLDDLIREIVESAEYADRHRADLLRRGLVANDRFTNDVSQYGETWLVVRDMVASASWTHYVVDVGARGKERSNSYDLLRHFGWRGLLIEANPRLIEPIRADFEGLDYEIACCAISDYNGVATFNIGANDDVSSLTKAAAQGWGEVRDEIEVQVRMLPEVLREHDAPLNFDLLSIDIEGEDVRVLNHLIDVSPYRPTWVAIEVAGDDPDLTLAGIGLSQKVCDAYDTMGRTPSNLLLKSREAAFGPERLVRALYLGLLDRPADESGLRVKSADLAQGRLRFEDLVGEFVGSDEFFERLPALIQRYGGDLTRDVVRSADVVSDLYEVLLGRPVDPEGLQAKLTGLAGRTRTVADIARELIGSEEFANAPPLEERSGGSDDGGAPEA